MNPKQEALAIAELAIDLSTLRPDRSIHCSVGAGAVSVTAFKNSAEIDWQENLYEWSHDDAYLPKLRFLRHELERMKVEALEEREAA